MKSSRLTRGEKPQDGSCGRLLCSAERYQMQQVCWTTGLLLPSAVRWVSIPEKELSRTVESVQADSMSMSLV